LSDVAKANSREPVTQSAAGAALSASCEAEAKAKFYIGDTMRRWCLQSLGTGLKAVILTGSLARNEATWRQAESGMQFLSDAEFIVIFKERHELPSAALVTLICNGAEEELRNQGVLCKLSFSAAYESYLLELGETVFGYELLNCGEVLYGDPDILLSKTRNTDIQISEEDGWRLLANRTLELLEIVPELLGDNEQLSEAAQYRLTKLYCDMATSILVFKHQFVSGYQGRSEALHGLQQRGLLSDLPFDIDGFVRRVAQCTEYKIHQVWDGPSPFLTRDSVQEAVGILRLLWAWELAQMGGVARSSPETVRRLHMRNQDLKTRLRGWAFVMRRRGVLDCLRYGWRWLHLMRISSPRYCVYAATLGFWRSLETAVSSFGFQVSSEASSKTTTEAPASSGFEHRDSKLETLDSARNWLPIGSPFGGASTSVNDLAKAILWNYQEFLVETTA
jgi:hypothetical protein